MNKEQMLVATIQDGTVIDHIPSSKLFKIAHILDLEQIDNPITIGNNLKSSRFGHKGVIKISGRFFTENELNKIALIAPNVHLNIIRDYEVVEKKQVSLPDEFAGIVKCTNPKCITNHEPMKTIFTTIDITQEILECKYCGRKITSDQVELL
ncbi:aspartate carbamoyltransferase regulatory subunit [Porphyromonas pogonae]|uniref:aspartate carbamoyltransferase regulatory subunit n=1 Tax=Porphyromonas pogonae TaxID=867595 RepID=UPI002E7767E9|nr:aspartate carbamoyltransferase regulatory subunit [Porphyromonas pogonae]